MMIVKIPTTTEQVCSLISPEWQNVLKVLNEGFPDVSE